MIDGVFKNIVIFLVSVICFVMVTMSVGTIIGGDEHDTYAVAWLIGSVMFGAAMVVAYGG